ncbi:acyl transferase family protein [Nocardia tenerifensis]|uniref:Acyl transferase family protein n=1 Tax=Nocardia tenerifensis TaxID=228006 RepID=A0A318JQC0_9NOCA|nr:acyltransferase domain-containing protein [Nocardia tenerifensis]PXX56299.1 acyl transferase family protein [Nocardia tenerifensis]
MIAQASLLTLSASTRPGLEEATDRLCDRLDRLDQTEFATLTGEWPGPQAHPWRRVLVSSGPAEAARRLRRRDGTRVLTALARRDRPMAWLFAGVGDQYPGLAAGLYAGLPEFRAGLDECLSLLRGHGLDLRPVLYPPDAAGRSSDLAALLDRKADTEPIHRTELAQPLLFAVQYALAKTWQALGLTPSALLGYSVGELAAACVAGVFSLPDALGLVVTRARLIDRLPRGGMLAVGAPVEAIAPYLGGCAVAAINGPELTVLAGTEETLAQTGDALAAAGIATRRQPATHAYHSPAMAPIAEPLRAAFAAVPRERPRIPLLSTVTGDWLADDRATDPGYWASQVVAPLRFADGLTRLWEHGSPVVLELGPGRTLSRILLAHPGLPADAVLTRTLPGAFERTPDRTVVLETAGRLWAAGIEFDWRPFEVGLGTS